jgi:hypothetical protein
MSVFAYNTTQCHFRRPQSEKSPPGKAGYLDLLLKERKKRRKKEMQKSVKERENERCKNIETDIAEGRIKNIIAIPKFRRKPATIFRVEELS